MFKFAVIFAVFAIAAAVPTHLLGKSVLIHDYPVVSKTVIHKVPIAHHATVVHDIGHEIHHVKAPLVQHTYSSYTPVSYGAKYVTKVHAPIAYSFGKFLL